MMGGGFGGRGGMGAMGDGDRPANTERTEVARTDLPDGETLPQGGDRGGRGQGGERPEGFSGQKPQDFNGEMPTMPEGEFPQGGFGSRGQTGKTGEANTTFYMQDKVNSFSGLTAAE